MPGKVPLSTRISQEDAAYLAQLKIDGAVTPSDKLRAIIKDARQRYRGTEDYTSSLKMATDILAPTLRIIRASENAAGTHSELMSRLGEWVAECFAYVVASNGAETELSHEQLLEIEAGLAKRVVVLMESVLQLGVTSRSSCYDPQIINDNIQPVLDIANVINKMKGGAI